MPHLISNFSTSRFVDVIQMYYFCDTIYNNFFYYGYICNTYTNIIQIK